MCLYISVRFLQCAHLLLFKDQVCSDYLRVHQNDAFDPTFPFPDGIGEEGYQPGNGHGGKNAESSFDGTNPNCHFTNFTHDFASHMSGYYERLRALDTTSSSSTTPASTSSHPSFDSDGAVLASMLRLPQHSYPCPRIDPTNPDPYANREIIERWECDGHCGIAFRFLCEANHGPTDQSFHYMFFKRFRPGQLELAKQWRHIVDIPEVCAKCGGSGRWNGVVIRNERSPPVV